MRGKGLMVALELVSDRATKKPIDKKMIGQVFETTYENGVMVRVSGNNIILSPPLVITADDVTEDRHGPRCRVIRRLTRIFGWSGFAGTMRLNTHMTQNPRRLSPDPTSAHFPLARRCGCSRRAKFRPPRCWKPR